MDCPSCITSHTHVHIAEKRSNIHSDGKAHSHKHIQTHSYIHTHHKRQTKKFNLVL
jgi:hypothetical protein